MKHEITIHEGGEAKDTVKNIVEVELGDYEVKAPNGIFKRGKLWEKGQKIKLDQLTAIRFMNLGEVKEAKK